MEALEFDTIVYEETDVIYKECPVSHHSLLEEFNESFYCHMCETIIEKPKDMIPKHIRKKQNKFSGRFNYAERKIKSIIFAVGDQDIERGLQKLKHKSHLKFNQELANLYNEMNSYHSDWKNENISPMAAGAKGISRLGHEVSVFLRYLSSKGYTKNINYLDLFYTILLIN